MALRNTGFAALLLALAAPAALAQSGTRQGDDANRGADGGVSSIKAGVDAWARRDYAAAVGDWRGPAAAGDPDAEFDLGQAYKLGRGVPQDLAQAETLFGKAAAKGHIRASDNYGLLLFQRGDHAQAMPYIQAAAARGDPRADYLLGIALFDGDNTPKDWVRAYAYETLAQQGGLAQAKSALAQMDTYIPMAQRQQGVALAGDLATQAEANRVHALASADLGTPPANTVPTDPASTGADHTSTQTPVAAAKPAPPRPAASRVPQAGGAGDGHSGVAPAKTAPARSQSPSPKSVSPEGGWMIQLGVFSVPAHTDTQWNRVKAMADVAGHARRVLPAGKMQRLLATGYDEAAARAACARLAAKAIACLPTKN